MGDQPIEHVNRIRDLGVIFDHKLDFNAHIEIYHHIQKDVH